MQPIPGNESANWEHGYGDFQLVPDFSTLRRLSWLVRTAMVICDLHNEKSGDPVMEVPRSMMVKQIKKARELGLRTKAGSECPRTASLIQPIAVQAVSAAETFFRAPVSPVGAQVSIHEFR